MRDLASIPEQQQQLLYALALMCSQFIVEEHDGQEVLDHMCMSAGEQAYKALKAYGLIEVSGRTATWTQSGLDLLQRPLNEWEFPK